MRYPVGELDVIARAPDPSGTIVFIEVKTRTTLDFGIAEAVTPRKLHRMHRAAYRWLTERHVPWSEVRFDVVAMDRLRLTTVRVTAPPEPSTAPSAPQP